MVAGSIWHATVRDQIRVYNFKESSSSTPTSIAESQWEKILQLIGCRSPSESNIKTLNFHYKIQIKNQ